MERRAHLTAAYIDLQIVAYLANHGQLRQAGELCWGSIVHAVSAADPGHEIQPPDRHHNSHPAPCVRPDFDAAVRRILNSSVPALPPADYSRALHAGQRILHNHFYHLNLRPAQLAANLATARHLAQRLAQHANQALPKAK